MDEASTWAGRPGKDFPKAGVAGPRHRRGAAQLQQLLVGSSGLPEAVVRMRGAQAAYFRAGWLIRFEPVFPAFGSGSMKLGPSLDAAVAARLRRLPPSLGASSVLGWRRLAGTLIHRRDGFTIDVGVFALALGLGSGIANNAPVCRTLRRIATFGLARFVDDGTYAVRANRSPTSRRHRPGGGDAGGP